MTTITRTLLTVLSPNTTLYELFHSGAASGSLDAGVRGALPHGEAASRIGQHATLWLINIEHGQYCQE